MAAECPICYGGMWADDVTDPVEYLTCFHKFHTYCIGNVARFAHEQGDTIACPTCRVAQPPQLQKQLVEKWKELDATAAPDETADDGDDIMDLVDAGVAAAIVHGTGDADIEVVPEAPVVPGAPAVPTAPVLGAGAPPGSSLRLNINLCLGEPPCIIH